MDELRESFLLESYEHLQKIQNLLLHDLNEQEKNMIACTLHNIKGTAGFLNLPHLGTLAHDAETWLKTLHKNARFKQFFLIIECMQNEIEPLLPLNPFPLKERSLISLKDIFVPFASMVKELGNSLQKNTQLSYQGEDIKIEQYIVMPLIKILTHTIRNAIAHGIEGAKERLKKGKSEIGKIELKASHTKTHIIIEVKDDGQGIDFENLKKVLKDRDTEKEWSNEDILNALFYKNITTQEEVSFLSGRGMGLSIIQDTVKSLSGTVKILTKRAQGTSFVFRIPARDVKVLQ